MRALGFFLGTLAGSAAMPDRAGQWRSSGSRAALDLEPVALPPVSVPAVVVGAFVLGAFAVGALAIGALAIGRLEVRKARLREVEIDSLTVRRFKATEEPGGESDSAES